ncbi:MAG: hypothetical protein ACR5K9_10405 [Wolbachia sp.]
MLGTLKKYKSDKANINQQLYNAIHEKVIGRKHRHGSPQEGDGTLQKCIELFKQGADPNVLIPSFIGNGTNEKSYFWL